MADAHKNFAYSTVATAPSPATTGTSLTLASGGGALFPTAPFNVTIWPASVQALASNAEVARCTAKSGDTLTIVRAQEGSSARSVVIGDQVAATITSRTLIEAESGVLDNRARPVPQLFRINFGYTSPNGYSEAQEGSLYGVRLMQTGDESHMAGMLAGNPDLKMFRYSSFTEIDPGDLGGINDGVGYTLANNGSNPNFFLYHGATRITSHAGAYYMADPADASYQAAVVANIMTQFNTPPAPWAGVFFDEVMVHLAAYGMSQTSDKYPTDAAWIVAVRSFLSAVVPTLRANGLKVLLNVTDNTGIPGAWQSVATLADGTLEESWTDGGSGLAQQDTEWPRKFSNIVWGEENKKITLLHSYNTTQAGNRYGLAASLLAASYDGYTFYATSNSTPYNSETIYTEYTTAAGLGPPMGSYLEVQSRVYKRDFAFGTVLVNTTGATSGLIGLGRSCTGSGLTAVSSTTVPAYSGYILLYN